MLLRISKVSVGIKVNCFERRSVPAKADSYLKETIWKRNEMKLSSSEGLLALGAHEVYHTLRKQIHNFA